MKRYIISFLAILLIVVDVRCLFSNTTNTKFNITGIDNPSRIALSGSGQKFVVWNNISNMQILTVQGVKQCETTFDRQIQRVLWPNNYYPLILPYPGDVVWRLNETSCKITQVYNFTKIVNPTNRIILITEMAFSWRGATPIFGGSLGGVPGVYFVIEIQLVRQNLLNFYSTSDVASPTYQMAVYSPDSKYIYVVLASIGSGSRTAWVFDTSKYGSKPIGQINLGAVSISSLATSRDNNSIIAVGTSTNGSGSTTSLFKFDSHGNNKNAGSRSNIAKGLAVGDGNVAVFIETGSLNFEVVRVADGQSLQNATYYGSGSTYIQDADYKNKVIIMLDNTGTIVTAAYQPDVDPDPIPDPVNPSLPVWVLVVGTVVGILLLSFILMYVFRKKLPESLRRKLPKIFNSPKDEEKKSLIEPEHEKSNANNRENQNSRIDNRENPIVNNQNPIRVVNPNPNIQPPNYVPPPIFVPQPNHIPYRPIDQPENGDHMSDAQIMRRQRQYQERQREEYLRQQYRLAEIDRRNEEQFQAYMRAREQRNNLEANDQNNFRE